MNRRGLGRTIRGGLWGVAVLSGCAAVLTRVLSGDLADQPSEFVAWWYLLAFLFRTMESAVAIGAAVFAIMAWFCRARAAALVLMVIAVALLIPVGRAIIPRRPPAATSATLGVLSANLQLGESSTPRLIEVIDSMQPDVILLQECTPARYAELTAALESRYAHRTAAFRDKVFGQAIFSHHAFVGEQDLHALDELSRGAREGGVVGLQDPQIRVAIMLNGRELVIQDVHLATVATTGTQIESRRQTASLVEWVQRETRGVLIMGDHNFTGRSAQAAAFSAAGLREAHAIAGDGLGLTWAQTGPFSRLPGFRIDRAYVGNEITVTESRVLGPIGSDHRPIFVRIGWETTR